MTCSTRSLMGYSFVTGMAIGGNQTYASVRPSVKDVSSSTIAISWTEPADTGKSPITGYLVSLYTARAIRLLSFGTNPTHPCIPFRLTLKAYSRPIRDN